MAARPPTERRGAARQPAAAATRRQPTGRSRLTRRAGDDLDIFLVAAPGLEEALAVEVRALGFKGAKPASGGVTLSGGWAEVWRANLEVRGTGRVIAGLATFPVDHLDRLAARARRIAWRDVLRPDVPVRVEATCRRSRIYHSGAAEQRIADAIRASAGCPLAEEAALTVRARIEDNVCAIGIDTSGELLHRRGHKEAVSKAPMRETMASLLLRQCRFNGREPVLDPMCGSGTFVIEAAEIAARLAPGRSRSFAFEQLATFDAAAWQAMRAAAAARVQTPAVHFFGSDRDAGAVEMSRANAERAGVAAFTRFAQCTIGDIAPPPEGPPGLVIVNPPYGARLGDKQALAPLYRALGQTLLARLKGWRTAIVTTEADLARATALPFLPPGPPISHGGLRVTLYRTEPLG